MATGKIVRCDNCGLAYDYTRVEHICPASVKATMFEEKLEAMADTVITVEEVQPAPYFTLHNVPVASKRGTAWLTFAWDVFLHIEHYTVPQYGDEGEDIATDYTPQQCLDAMKKYMARAGRNARGEIEAQRDFFKMAHYVQLAMSAWRKGA